MSDFNAVEIDSFCSSFVNQQPLPVQVSAGKRSCVPDGSTPGKCKPKKKANEKSGGARKSLFSAKGPIQQGCNTDKNWTTEETAALVQHICLYWDNAYTNNWSKTKSPILWNDCAIAVNKICNSSQVGA